MTWDFQTEPEFEAQLQWAAALVRHEVMPLETLELDHDSLLQLVKPLQEQVRERGLWAAHLEPELGGQGMGQVKLALLHEVLGQLRVRPARFREQRSRLGQRRAVGARTGDRPPA